jgi:hypothetical protein
MDGECLRSINNALRRIFYSVHDSVLCDWLEVDNLIDVCNTTLSSNKFDHITWDNKIDLSDLYSFFNIM